MNASAIIDEFGGTAAVARIFEIEPPSVSEWKRLNKIPKARLMYLRLLRPEVFESADQEQDFA